MFGHMNLVFPLMALLWTGRIRGDVDICDDSYVGLIRLLEPVLAGDILYTSTTNITIVTNQPYIEVHNGVFRAKTTLSLDNDPALCSNPVISLDIACDTPFGTLTYSRHFEMTHSNNFHPEFPSNVVVKHIREVMPKDTVVFKIEENKATDRDCGEVTRIVGKETAELALLAGIDEMVTKREFDYEAGDREFNFTVTAQDSGQPSRLGTFLFTLVVEDVDDENPAFRDNSYSLHVIEGYQMTPKWMPATPPIAAYDQDLGINAPIVFSIPDETSPAVNPVISIQRETGQLMVNGTLDRETADTYMAIVKAEQADNNLRTATTTLTLYVDDINDNRPEFSPDNYHVSIQEHTAESVSIVRVHASDADNGGNSLFTYALTSQTEMFSIDPYSGYISVRNSTALDRETQDMFVITVNATEQEPQVGASCTTSCTATVTLTLLDINDNSPEFDQTSYQFAAHNTSVGEVVGQVTATDRDIGDNGRVEYSIHDDTVFSVDSTSGIITLVEAAKSENCFLISACDLARDTRCGAAKVTVTIPSHHHTVITGNFTINIGSQ